MTEVLTKIVEQFGELKYSLLEAQTFDPETFGFPEVYYKIMETDTTRVGAYQQTFAHYNWLKDCVVCEAGIGRMALTKHFLPHVKKAYLIENNPKVIPFVKSELARNGWANKVELIQGNAMEVTLPEKVDFVIGELMSIYCANEFQVQIFRHLRQFLKPEGKLIPERIWNLGQLAHATYENGYTHYPLFFTRHLPTILSSLEIINITDLYKDTEIEVNALVPFNAILTGTVNSLYMQSWVQLAEGFNFTGTDSLMPPTVTALAKEATIKGGAKIELNAHYTYGTSLEQAKFEIQAP